MSDGREAPERMDLHAYFDGQLPPEERARFERALASDPALREGLRELRELDAALGALPGHAAPPGFSARVTRVARARRRRGAILRLAIPLAAAAAALLAVVLDAVVPDRPAAEPALVEDAYIWEADIETYGSLALTDLEDQILEELEAS
jgi:anti-sigma factor RsiW